MEEKTLRRRYKPFETEKMTSPESDPQGSYTGTPANEEETPVQDADDL